MVEVAASSEASYCVDTHEVTNQQYALYLATDPASITVADCIREGPEPHGWFESGAESEMPVRSVTWCHADAFCRANGKRLCGRIGGGALDGTTESANDPSQSEWFNACSGGGTRAYPYGNTYEESRCTDGQAEVMASGSRVRCEGGFAGIFDMNGNVSEHENACAYVPEGENKTEFEPNYRCLLRGELIADYESGCYARPRFSNSADVRHGIRCCADVNRMKALRGA